ncbi:uncharacterized protein DS421_12g369430 [Arachis hypogaea]|nr:uncharacterized protein DS421_16g540120 [Arachis hypogaea]QHO24116.1 uncharacterized protein DS421_12g369430 [Arachis hypogaea]
MSRLELLLLLRVVGAEVASVAGAVPGPVRNRSCFVLLFRAVYAAAKMCGAVL